MPKVRLPLAGVYNTRPGEAYGATFKDHRLVNCLQVTQSDRLSGKKRLEVIKRPGWADHTTPSAGNVGSAITVWTGQGAGTKVMSCFNPTSGSTDSTLYDGTTSKGALTGKARGIVETSVSGTSTLLMATSDSTGWSYQDGGSATKISDSDFPGNASRTTVGNFAPLGGFVFIMDAVGRIYNSDLNSVTAWTANNYLTAGESVDIGIGVIRHKDVLIGFLRSRIEVFRNAGNATGSPLERIDSLTQLIGCVSADAVATCLDKIYFAGGRGSNLGIWEYTGGSLRRISTPEVEGGLTLASTTVALSSIGFLGRYFVIVQGGTTSFIYCVEEETWHEWYNATNQLWYKCAGVAVSATVVNYGVSRSSTSGKVYKIDPSSLVYADTGTAVTSTIQSANWDGGTDKRKFLTKLSVIADRKASSENLSIQWYDDDFQTLSSARTVDLSHAQPFITRCGSFFRRSFVLTHSAATNLRIEALELEYEVAE